MQRFERLVLFIQDARQRWRWLGYLLTGASVFYIAALLIFGDLDWQKLRQLNLWLPLAAALLLYLASLVFQYLVWTRFIAPYHRAGWQDLAIYGRALLLRRLPGGVWHWVGRTAMYTGSTQVPGRVTLLANFLEWVLLLLLAAAIVLGGVSSWPAGLRLLLASLPVLAAVGLAYAWQPGERSRLARLLEALGWLALYSLAWLMGGLIVMVFSTALQGSAPAAVFTWNYATWVWALTGGSSLAVIVVPSGLGIRELTLTWILGERLGTEGALAVALLIRLSFLAADLLWGFLSMLAGRFLEAKSKPEFGANKEAPR